MSVFDQWLLRTSAGEVTSSILLMLGLLFAILRVWPWWSRTYMPARQEIEKMRLAFDQQQQTQQIDALKEISSAMVSLKELVGQNQLVLNRLLERDSTYISPTPPKSVRKPGKKSAMEKEAA